MTAQIYLGMYVPLLWCNKSSILVGTFLVWHIKMFEANRRSKQEMMSTN